MEKRTLSHPLSPEDCGYLDHGVDVVGGIEEWKASGEDGQENDASGPDIDLGCLACAFQEDFWGPEAAGAGSVCSARGSCVAF